MISIQSLQQAPSSLAGLFTLPFSSFPYSVGGSSTVAKREYALARTDADLFVAFRVEAGLVKHPRDCAGEFVEGLWEYDVAELFLLDSSTGRYEEFNLSPAGAWWRCAFSSYRVLDSAVNCSVCRPNVWSGKDNTVSLVAMSFSFAELSISFKAKVGERLSVCAIVGAGADREYLSTSPLNSQKPDFHQTQFFSALQILP